MREIKFRAWDKENHVMDYDIMYSNDWECIEYDCERSKIILMQYTGLKDRDGNKIYEGDILHYNHFNWIVEWSDNGSFILHRIRAERKGMASFQIFASITMNIFSTIIGNIYENPELLEMMK